KGRDDIAHTFGWPPRSSARGTTRRRAVRSARGEQGDRVRDVRSDRRRTRTARTEAPPEGYAVAPGSGRRGAVAPDGRVRVGVRGPRTRVRADPRDAVRLRPPS